MTPDETIAKLRADLSQIESEQINALGMIATLKSDLAREKERADRAEAGFTAAHIRADSAEARADALKKELAEAKQNFDRVDERLGWAHIRLSEAGFPDHMKWGEDFHGNEDFVHIGLKSRIEDCIKAKSSAETRLAALQARADGLAKALDGIVGELSPQQLAHHEAVPPFEDTRYDLAKGYRSLSAYRAFTAEGQKE